MCIDLIFTKQPNLVIESGVHASMDLNCHHPIVFAKPNLKIEYPRLYERLIWDYKYANEQMINRVIERFNWEKSFEGKNAHYQVYLFNKIILNIFKKQPPEVFCKKTCS